MTMSPIHMGNDLYTRRKPTLNGRTTQVAIETLETAADRLLANGVQRHLVFTGPRL